MEKIIKTLPAEKGELFVTSAGLRQPLAHFDGRVEIIERTELIPILGTVQRGTKRIYASFVVCGDLEYLKEPKEGSIHSGMVFDAAADVGNERTRFLGLRFTDSDPIKNEIVFEIADLELIKRLINL